MSLLDKLKNKVKPLFNNEALGFPSELLKFQVYDPSVLAKEADLLITDTQTKIEWLGDKVRELNEQIKKLKNEKATEENLNKRQKLSKEIAKIKEDMDNQISNFLEAVCKLETGEFKNRISIMQEKIETNVSDYADYQELLEYSPETLIVEIFGEVNDLIAKKRSDVSNEGKEED